MIGIYELYNKANGKKYYGQSWNLENRWDQYRWYKAARQPRLHNAIIKYGLASFEFRVLETFDSPTQDQLDARERYYISNDQTCDPRKGYNMQDGGSNGRHSPESIQKMKEIHTGHPPTISGPFSAEHRARISEGQRGRVVSEETRQKQREAKLGKKQDPADIAKRAIAIKESWKTRSRSMPVETRNKISASLKGKPRKRMSEEVKQKMSEAAKRRWEKERADAQ